jgi:hypothetical protein
MNITNQDGAPNTPQSRRKFTQVRDYISDFGELNNTECIDYYYTRFESQRGDVIIVLNDSTSQEMSDQGIIERIVPSSDGNGNNWD